MPSEELKSVQYEDNTHLASVTLGGGGGGSQVKVQDVKEALANLFSWFPANRS